MKAPASNRIIPAIALVVVMLGVFHLNTRNRVALKTVRSSDGIVGKWSWYQNVPVTFNADGTASNWSNGAPLGGNWELVNARTRNYHLHWASNYTDDALLSADGNVLVEQGSNAVGAHKILGARPGWFDDQCRSIKARAAAEGVRAIGAPVDNGGTIAPHWWYGGNYSFVVQDFEGGSHGPLTVFATPSGAYEISNLHLIRHWYIAAGGIGVFGPPTGDEIVQGEQGQQSFASGQTIGWDSRGLWSTFATPGGGSGTAAAAGAETGSPALDNRKPELELQVGHRSWVKSVSFSADGKLAASADNDGEMRLWDPLTGTELCTLLTSGQHVLFSPVDSDVLATDVPGAVVLMDVREGRVRHFLPGAQAPFAFSTDRRFMAASEDGGAVGLWDLASDQKLWSKSSGGADLTCVVIDPGRSWVACGHKDGTLRLLQLRSVDPIPASPPVLTASGHPGITSAAVSSDGRLFAAGRQDGSISVYNLPSWSLRTTLHNDYWDIWTVEFLPDNHSLISSGGDSMGRLWDARSGKLIRTLFSGKGYVFGSSYCPQHGLAAFATALNLVYLVQTNTGQTVRTLGRTQGSWAVDVSPDGRTAAVGNSDNRVRVWDLSTGSLMRVLDGFSRTVRGVTISPDGGTLAAVSVDGEVRVWDRVSGTLLWTAPGTGTDPAEARQILPVSISPDSRLLVCPSDWGKIRCWDLRTGRSLPPFLFKDARMDTLCFSPDGSLLAAVGMQGNILMWDVRSHAIRLSIDGKAIFRSFAFSADGSRFVTGDWGGNIREWYTEKGRSLTQFASLGNMVLCMRVSPDGKTLAASSQGGVQLLDMATGMVKLTLGGPQGFVDSVRFTPDGRRVIGAGTDGGVWVWDATSGKLLATMLGLPEHEQWLTATPEGFFNCSTNAEYLVRWRLGNQLYPAERYIRRFRRPDLVEKALNLQPFHAPGMTQDDVPPSLQFVEVSGNAALDMLTVTLEAYGHRGLKSVELMVNGRPLPPTSAVPTSGDGRRIAAAPSIDQNGFDPNGQGETAASFTARPISLGSKAIRLGAKSISLGAKSISLGAKSIRLGAKPVELGSGAPGTGQEDPDTSRENAMRYTFRLPIPLGTNKIDLRAVAYDSAELGSNPAEVNFVRTGVSPDPGNLYVLAIGLSHYLNGSTLGSGRSGQFPNLQFPAADATSVASRLQREGSPLYKKTVVHLLTDQQATLENIRKQFKWLQATVRPGQLDTVIVFLSGHGVSDLQGHYYFPSYTFDKKHLQETGLSAEELQDALGGKLQARNVFLFVDTCHSGALAGKSDDLSFGVHASGVYMIASTGAGQSSYESSAWGHGAFTSALLWALNQKSLSDGGIIRYNRLMSAVPRRIANLLQSAGHSALAEEPVVPLEGRNVTVPVAEAL